MTMPVFSVIAPAYNEATGLQEFYRRVRAVMDVLGDSWELVLINDGSRDNTL
jgi:polyisoprenyl-phosphate glycosyltransferase